MRNMLLFTLLALVFVTTVPLPAVAGTPTDRAALQGVKSGKGIFDINVTEAEKLPLYLQVIKETHAGLKKQGVKPDLVVTFRGAAVRFVSSDRKNFTADAKEALDDSDKLIIDLAKQGVRFEACAVATRLFQVDNASILPAITVVGNTFISLIGYQAKGYGLIPID